MILFDICHFWIISSIKRKRKRRIAVYIRFGRSLWSANRLPAQMIKETTDGSVYRSICTVLSLTLRERLDNWTIEKATWSSWGGGEFILYLARDNVTRWKVSQNTLSRVENIDRPVTIEKFLRNSRNETFRGSWRSLGRTLATNNRRLDRDSISTRECSSSKVEVSTSFSSREEFAQLPLSFDTCIFFIVCLLRVFRSISNLNTLLVNVDAKIAESNRC